MNFNPQFSGQFAQSGEEDQPMLRFEAVRHPSAPAQLPFAIRDNINGGYVTGGSPLFPRVFSTAGEANDHIQSLLQNTPFDPGAASANLASQSRPVSPTRIPANQPNPQANQPLQKLKVRPMPPDLKLDPTAIEMNKAVPNTKWRMPLIPIVKKYAKLYNVPEYEIWRIIGLESNGNPREYSPTGAIGAMQLEPGTAREQGITNPWDRDQNVKGGVSYYAHLLKQFGGDQRLAMAAYNAGPGAVYSNGGVPPFKETQKYVRGIPGSEKLTPAEIASHQASTHPRHSRRR